MESSPKIGLRDSLKTGEVYEGEFENGKYRYLRKDGSYKGNL